MQRHIKTAILALFAAFLVAVTLPTQAIAQGKPKAAAVEAIKDVGTIAKGEKIVHDFLIRNDGDAVLEILSIQPACGCTVAEFDKSIAPGKTGKVHAVVDTSTFGGPISKGLTVFTNDPATPQLELTVRAKVEPYIAVKPGYARYVTVQGENVEGDITQTLWATDGSSMEVVGVDSPWPYLKVSFHEAKAEERLPDIQGKQWRVEMKLANDAKVGPLAEYVTVRTNHPKQKVVQIPITGFVRPVVAVTPQVADFGTIELKDATQKVLNVRNFATEPIKVTGVEENIQGIEVKLEPLNDGREYQVQLTLSPSLPKGNFDGKITIRTDSPKVPFLEVPLKGTIL
jgi:hypothetical protein